jgi:mannosyltransferase
MIIMMNPTPMPADLLTGDIAIGQSPRTAAVHPPPPDRRRIAGAAGRLDWALIVPPLVTLAMLLWGTSAHYYVHDEAATISAATRSLPDMIRMLGHVDAVHSVYYTLMWVVVRVLGTSELAIRLPSMIAMTATALGVTALGRRLRSRRAGLYAGLMFATLPMVSATGQYARPYAMVTGAAVLASYLLVRALAQPRLWPWYAVALAALGLMNLFGLLLLPAHAIMVLRAVWPGSGGDGSPDAEYMTGARWRPARRWLACALAACAVASPVAVLGWLQRAQVDGLPGQPQLATLLGFAEGTVASAVAIVLLGLLGMARSDWPDRSRARQRRAGGQRGLLAWLSVPWLVLPPLILFSVSDLAHPFYVFRYVAFCLPAVALLAGAGLAALGQPWRIGMLATLVLLGLAAQLVVRQPGPYAPVKTASVFLAAHERPGDAVIYPQGWVPVINITAPQGYAPLRDLSLAKTPTEAQNLAGSTVSPPVLKARERGISRIWAIEFAPDLQPVGKYLIPGFRCERVWRSGRLYMWLCVQQHPPGGPYLNGEPHSPRQRGAHQSTSGLLRQFVLKGTRLSARNAAGLAGSWNSPDTIPAISQNGSSGRLECLWAAPAACSQTPWGLGRLPGMPSGTGRTVAGHTWNCPVTWPRASPHTQSRAPATSASGAPRRSASAASAA